MMMGYENRYAKPIPQPLPTPSVNTTVDRTSIPITHLILQNGHIVPSKQLQCAEKCGYKLPEQAPAQRNHDMIFTSVMITII